MYNKINSKNFDFNPVNKMTKSFVVASTPRSGSSLLGHLLWSTSLAGSPIEYFHKDHSQDYYNRWKINNFDRYMELLTMHRTSPNGVFGVKTHFRQLINFELNEARLNSILKNPKYIFIKRRDKESQAISFYKAMETNQWSATENEDIKGTGYDFLRIYYILDSLISEEKSWETFFKNANITPYAIYYEDLVSDNEKYIKEILEFLEIDTDNFILPPTKMKKMANSETEEWLIRFHKDISILGSSIDTSIDINISIADAIVKKIDDEVMSLSIWGISELSDIVEKKLNDSGIKINYYIDTWAEDGKLHNGIKVITPQKAIANEENNFVITSLGNRFKMRDTIKNITDKELEIIIY